MHVLILPKRVIACLSNAPNADPSLYADLVMVIQQLIYTIKLKDVGYHLVANDAQNQSVPVWHWHSICDAACKIQETPGVAYD